MMFAQHIEVDDFCDAGFTKGRIVRVPHDGHIACDVPTYLGDQGCSYSLSAIAQVLSIQRDWLAPALLRKGVRYPAQSLASMGRIAMRFRMIDPPCLRAVSALAT